MEGRSERTQGQAKMAGWNSFSYICTRALHSFWFFAHWRAASTVINLLPKATFTSSIQPNLGLPRTRPPLTSASTPFWIYTHSFFPHAQTISILSDLLYSQLPFYSSSPTHLFIINSMMPLNLIRVKNCSRGVDDLQASVADISDYGLVISDTAACPLQGIPARDFFIFYYWYHNKTYWIKVVKLDFLGLCYCCVF